MIAVFWPELRRREKRLTSNRRVRPGVAQAGGTVTIRTPVGARGRLLSAQPAAVSGAPAAAGSAPAKLSPPRSILPGLHQPLQPIPLGDVGGLRFLEFDQ